MPVSGSARLNSDTSPMDNQFDALRQQMVAEVVAETVFLTPKLGKAALNGRVVDALAKVARHEFVPLEIQPYSYLNRPLPIGYGKTISQPFIVALMTDLLNLQPEHTVLEIGTGVGYQAAILAELVQKVYSIELIEELARDARRRLKRLKYDTIEVRIGNGYYGW